MRSTNTATSAIALRGAESNDLPAVEDLLTKTNLPVEGVKAEKYFPTFGFDETRRDAVPSEIRQTAEFKDICPSSAKVMRRALGSGLEV